MFNIPIWVIIFFLSILTNVSKSSMPVRLEIHKVTKFTITCTTDSFATFDDSASSSECRNKVE
jgi:hypothetical protein